MREILFRGKRTDNGEWVEGAYIQVDDSDNFCYIFERYNLASSLPPLELVSIYAKKVIPETVGQYTGLTDRNGKRIFEGDIILFEDESPTNYEYHDCTEMRCGEIKFDEGEFYLTNRIAVEMGDLIYDGKLDGVIVGNIHDNPDLLK